MEPAGTTRTEWYGSSDEEELSKLTEQGSGKAAQKGDASAEFGHLGDILDGTGGAKGDILDRVWEVRRETGMFRKLLAG